MNDQIGAVSRRVAAACARGQNVIRPAAAAAGLAAGLAIGAADVAAARDITFAVSNGGRVTVERLEDITSCEQVESAQEIISGSRYRSGAPSSVTDPRDRDLLSYEESLARLAFELCPAQRGLSERLHGFGGQ